MCLENKKDKNKKHLKKSKLTSTHAEVLWFGRNGGLQQAARRKKNKGKKRAGCRTQPPLNPQTCGVISVASYRGGPQSQIRSM